MKLSTEDASDSRPNLLFIMTDQQFADVIGGLGRVQDPSGLKTPGMDRLLRNGVFFDRAYATYPLCVPCRNSLMTGRYPHEIDVNINQGEKEGFLQVPMMGSYLSQAGYACGYVGKWHLAVPPEDEASHGFPFVRHAAANRIDDQVMPGCCAFLDQWDAASPFCLVASWVNPHDICEYARIEAGIPDRLPNGELGEPPASLEQLPPLRANHAEAEDEPAALKRLRANPEEFEWLARLYPTQDYTERNWRRYMWAYHRMVEKVDAQILSLLEELDRRGLSENTLIVFTSDHGEGYGSHQWNQKICFYEESARVPFLIAGPGVKDPGRIDSQHLLNIGLDVIPTLLDAAGADIPDSLPGASAYALAQAGEDAVPWRNSTVLQCEFGGFGPKNQSGIRGRCVLTESYKYIRYFDEQHPEEASNEQLFHLPSDPGEMNNLAGHAEHRELLEQHRALLNAYAREHGDTRRVPIG